MKYKENYPLVGMALLLYYHVSQIIHGDRINIKTLPSCTTMTAHQILIEIINKMFVLNKVWKHPEFSFGINDEFSDLFLNDFNS